MTPNNSCAPPNAPLKPVIVSSKISIAPFSVASLRRPSRYPGRGMMMPQLLIMGSVRMAAISFLCVLNASSTYSRLFQGSTTTLSSTFFGIALAVVVDDRFGMLPRPEILVLVGVKAEEDVVHPAVIMALELDELRPSGYRTRQTQHGLDGFRARVVEVHHFEARNGFDQQSRHFHLQGMWLTESAALVAVGPGRRRGRPWDSDQGSVGRSSRDSR